jgi:hypothetical protein
MRLSRSQFAAAARADEKWVENAARMLGRPLRYSPDEARLFGLIRVLADAAGTPMPRAAEMAARALREPPDSRAVVVAVGGAGAAALVIDLARYHSTFAAALSAALHHGGPRRRGRPVARVPRGRRQKLAMAESYGVDLTLLRGALARSPAERLSRLDENASFITTVRRARR